MPDYLCPTNIVSNGDCRNYHADISPWLDEQIWGHRIWDNQTPWLLFLEFLIVAEACFREGRLFDERGVYFPLEFRPYRRLYLRNILFNNQFVDEYATRIDTQHNDSAIWQEWIQQMNREAQGDIIRNFSYLKDRFSSFRDFATVVRILRSTAVEGERNRRWSSRFVFPFGPHGLYEDLNVSRHSVSREFINFGRSGELLYLMLCRSKAVEQLRKHFVSFFDESRPVNKLLKRLQPDRDEDLQRRGQSYLPYITHHCFDIIGEDWKSILDLNLPEFDAYQYLVNLSAFHVMLYQLHTAAWFIPNRDKVYFVCELIAPQKTLVRELSISNFQQNNILSMEAIDAYILRISKSPEWLRAVEGSTESEAFRLCREMLQNQVWWPPSRSDDSNAYLGGPIAEHLLQQLKDMARKRHRQHAGNVHRAYGGAIGLISRRGTNRLRYAPNDVFLKTLVVTNVNKPKDFFMFLADLYNRYGLVFGEREASLAISAEKFDQKVFQANTERLERRLSSMGMLRRLSDACAYVVNPFVKEDQ